MKRYDLSDTCDGEFVRFADVKPALDYLHLLRAEILQGRAETASLSDKPLVLDRRHLPTLDAILGDYRPEGAVAGHDGDG